MTTDSPLIVRIGQALWGERWQADMADALAVSRNTVQDWRQGRFQPRPGVYMELFRIAHERQALLDDLIEELKTKSGGE